MTPRERDTVGRETDVEREPRSRGRDRGVVAFDNSGTVSDVVVERVGFTDDADYDVPVPGIREDRPTALVNVCVLDHTLLDTDGSLGSVLGESDASIHLALSNLGTTDAEARRSPCAGGVSGRDEVEARRSTLADTTAPARLLFGAAERLRGRIAEEHGRDDTPVGLQLTVELDPATVHRGYAYAAVPRPESRRIVEAVRERGFDVHLVSGDAREVLESVAAHVGIPPENVHALQSPDGKAETVSALRERTGGPVVMVGDYVNDRLAFERADRAVLVCETGDPDPTLARRVDAVAGSLSDVLTRL